MTTSSNTPRNGALTPRPWLWLILIPAIALRLWYAAAEPNSDRFFDERISLANVAKILDSGSLQPANFWYQSLSHLPQTLLVGGAEKIWQLTDWETFRMRDAEGFRPNAYHLCRALMVSWSALSLWWTFCLGRRLFSTRVAWLGTFILALVPWHVIVAARFKPDGLLLFLTLITFGWTLDVVERPDLKRYLRVGLGVGLVLSTKLNGIEVVMPLILVSLVLARHELKILGRLCLAGLTSIVVYLAFNPWLGGTLHALKANKEIYARQAAAEEASHLGVLVQSVTSLLRADFHGLLLGCAALAGFLLLLRHALQPDEPLSAQRLTANAPSLSLPPRLATWALLSFPVGHALFYAATSERFKENHHVQVVPFTSLLAAFFVLKLIDGLTRLPPPKARLGTLATLLLALLMATTTFNTVRFVYEDVVPTTFGVALRAVTSRLPQGEPRLICREGANHPREAARLRGLGMAVVFHPNFTDVEPTRLDACDALIFSAARTQGETSKLYLSRLASASPQRVTTSAPQWFRRRGDRLILMLNDWQSIGGKEALSASTAEPKEPTLLPLCGKASSYWLEMMVPVDRVATAVPWVEAARVHETDGSGNATETALHWQWVAKRKHGHLFVSERRPCPSTEGQSQLQLTDQDIMSAGKGLRLWMRRWQPGVP